MSFFNTTHEDGADLRDYRDRARTQEERIRAYFEVAAEFLYTPSQILEYVFRDEDVPLTSVRRAMTSLTQDNILLKTEVKRQGKYGRPEYCWRRRLQRVVQHDMFA